jgi:hypothetical protein
MPKESKLQPGFQTGEISNQSKGRVDNPRYETALDTCINYIPLTQGPLIRRPGTKYAASVKNPAKPPVLIPFQFSQNQNFMLEFGDKYIRFYQNEAQVLCNTSAVFFQVQGLYGQPDRLQQFQLNGVRVNALPGPGEVITSASFLSTGSVLELQSPYAWADLNFIKFSQKQDTIYLTHPSYPAAKLQRTGLNYWDLKQILFQDGPYLPLNSYASIADSANIVLQPVNAGFSTLTTEPAYSITSTQNVLGLIQVNAPGHTFNNGDRVFISGVFGTTEANNVTSAAAPVFTNSSPSQAYWTAINVVTNSSLQLANSIFINNYVGSGIVQPALFQLITTSSVVMIGSSVVNQSAWEDVQIGSSQLSLRTIGLINNGNRYWGHINQVYDAAHCAVEMGQGQNLPLVNSTIAASVFWQMGVHNLALGFPSATCFHQDRLVFNGPQAYPQEIDASMTSIYEVFSASGSNIQVNANNALQFSLNSQDLNSIQWMKSNVQGLLCGTQAGEWAITSASQNTALSPTSIQATQVTAFGSYNADAILSGNAALYIQRAQRKVRELLYFWQVANFRSTDISTLSQTITLPSIIKLVNQKEPHPTIWGIKGDGNLISLTYNRDDVTLEAGAAWARHKLGGQSDTSGTPPKITSIATIPSSDTTFDELWMVTNRSVNGAQAGFIEYTTKPFDDVTPQELAYHFDAGVTYQSSIIVTGFTQSTAGCTVTAPNHGLANSSVVRFYNTIGMNISYTDVNGNINSSNAFNYQTFVVQSSTTNTFVPFNFNGQTIDTGSCSAYIGSAIVRALVSQISGVTWLANETVSLLCDGKICANTTVSPVGTVGLPFPAAVVQVGYAYNSDAKMLRTHDGSAQGTSIGSTRRVNRVAFMLHNVGDFSFGNSFTSLIPAEFVNGDVNSADTMVPLFNGIIRDGIESDYGFDDPVCFRQSSGLPGMVQAVVRFLEEFDV